MRAVQRIVLHPNFGLAAIVLLLGIFLTAFAGTHTDRVTGATVNNFLNPSTLVQVMTDTSFFAIMAVGMTLVIVSGGIDLSIGSIYALCGVGMALILRANPTMPVPLAFLLCCAIGLVAGLFNGSMVAKLNVHPFIITLGTMWIYRGIAFVSSKAESLLVPPGLTEFAKNTLGMKAGLYPVPMLVMLLVVAVGAFYLQKTVPGRYIVAVGGNSEAARYSGLPIGRIVTGVYVVTGLTAAIAAFMGASYYGSASSNDANGYELYVVASAVVGGASLKGGRGTVLGAFLGALLIVLIRQAIRTLGLDQNYEWIIVGTAVIIAVVLDRWSAISAERRALKVSL